MAARKWCAHHAPLLTCVHHVQRSLCSGRCSLVALSAHPASARSALSATRSAHPALLSIHRSSAHHVTAPALTSASPRLVLPRQSAPCALCPTKQLTVLRRLRIHGSLRQWASCLTVRR